MKQLKVLTVFLLAALFWTAAFAEEEKIVESQDIREHQIIRLHYIGGITPAVAHVKPGTTVIWMNNSKEVLELQFEGKQVTLACKSPVHFVVDDNGSFISNRIPNGSVASLCFVEKGEFNYVARKVQAAGSISQYRDSIKEFKGKIIVE